MQEKKNNIIRTRFAPSPTGFLHIGGLRTALYSYLYAKKHNGAFLLRIEDTDQARNVQGAVDNLINTLNWAGITFDEGPGKEGSFGPYIQSQRLDLYKKYTEQLISEKHAYYCFCSSERLDQLRQKQIAQKLPPAYDRHCRNIDPIIALEKTKSEPFVVRMKVPLTGEITFNDLIRGKITIAYKNIDDQIILKSDGFPTYHLAVVVDDKLMEISHVIRGEEWLPSTPKHLLLYEYFGWHAPEFAHLPLLLNPDRSKLSKRQGDVAVEDYRKKGFLPEALVNFVALLGWNPGDEREIFSLNELVEAFSFAHVHKAGAVFDVTKLEWMNGLYLHKKTNTEILELIKLNIDPEFETKLSLLKHEQILILINLYKDKFKVLSDLAQIIITLDQAPSEYEANGLEQFVTPETCQYLTQLIEKLKATEWNLNDLTTMIKSLVKELNIKFPNMAQPIRLALTGTITSPGIYEMLVAFGKDESLNRLTTFLKFISNKN
ncbi:MAG: glutamate--tRNA ligase [Candidatus Babeliales bacterium]|nr:glutamate--tRNA ligase [Candidatus Babeliales bacterium]